MKQVIAWAEHDSMGKKGGAGGGLVGVVILHSPDETPSPHSHHNSFFSLQQECPANTANGEASKLGKARRGGADSVLQTAGL